MDCIVHGVAKSQTRLSNFHFQFHFTSLVCERYIYIHIYNIIHVHAYTHTHI